MKKKKIVIFIVGMFFTINLNMIIPGNPIHDSEQLIFINEPPSKPLVQGPSEVDKGESFSLYVQSTDPDGDDIYYRTEHRSSIKSKVTVQTFGPYPSGQNQTLGSFSFSSPPPGTYQGLIKVCAIDVHNAYSEYTLFTTTAPILYLQDYELDTNVSLFINNNFDHRDFSVQADSSTSEITFYFTDYLNITNNSFPLLPLVSLTPPTSPINLYYPPYVSKDLQTQSKALTTWFTYWLLSTFDFNNGSDDIFDNLEIFIPHYLRIVETYQNTLNETLTIDGDVVFQLDFKSRIGSKIFHKDYVKASLYTWNEDSILIPKLIKNQTMKIQQNIFSPIHSQDIILENVQCNLDHEDFLIFAIEIIPTNRTITSQWANNDTLIHLLASKISGILLKMINNSNNYWLKEIFQYIAMLQDICAESNITQYDYANLANAILGPSFVYDSIDHPSSVTVSFSSLRKMTE